MPFLSSLRNCPGRSPGTSGVLAHSITKTEASGLGPCSVPLATWQQLFKIKMWNPEEVWQIWSAAAEKFLSQNGYLVAGRSFRSRGTEPQIRTAASKRAPVRVWNGNIGASCATGRSSSFGASRTRCASQTPFGPCSRLSVGWLGNRRPHRMLVGASVAGGSCNLQALLKQNHEDANEIFLHI